MRHFNTTGPCDPELHYMLPAEGRLPGLDRLLARGAYFVVHAPRQTGKTTAMQALAERLTREGRYAALYFSCEGARAIPEDIDAAAQAIWGSALYAASDSLPESLQPPEPQAAPPGGYLRTQLAAWARACPKPLPQPCSQESRYERAETAGWPPRLFLFASSPAAARACRAL